MFFSNFALLGVRVAVAFLYIFFIDPVNFFICVCVRACVRACARVRACVRACVRVRKCVRACNKFMSNKFNNISYNVSIIQNISYVVASSKVIPIFRVREYVC